MAGMTVEQLAAQRGRTVEEVLAACRHAGVLAWSGFTPLDEREVADVDAALAGSPPAAGAAGWGAPAPGWTPPPPTYGAPTLPPPAFGEPPTGGPPPPPPGAPGTATPYGTPMPPPPYQPLQPTGGRRVARGVGVGVAILLSIGVRAGVGELFDDDGGAVDTSDRSGLVDLAVGTCYLDRSGTADALGGVDAEADEVDCDDPHDGEVFHRDVLPGGEGAAYLGDDATFEDAADRCLPRFQPFVGLPYEQSELDFVVFYPSSESWEFLEDRTVICAVVTIDGSQLSGTMAGSRR